MLCYSWSVYTICATRNVISHVNMHCTFILVLSDVYYYYYYYYSVGRTDWLKCSISSMVGLPIGSWQPPWKNFWVLTWRSVYYLTTLSSSAKISEIQASQLHDWLIITCKREGNVADRSSHSIVIGGRSIRKRLFVCPHLDEDDAISLCCAICTWTSHPYTDVWCHWSVTRLTKVGYSSADKCNLFRARIQVINLQIISL